MSKFDRTCIVADLESKLAAVDSTTNTFEAYALSASVKALTNDRQVTVACACDLPDLESCTDIPDGQPIYVEEYQVPVINSKGCWIGIDGRFLRRDLPDTTLWSMGDNCYLNAVASGQLGTNSTTCYSTPIQEYCGGNDWCMVVASSISTFGIKTDGTLWSWGRGNCGRLGTNNIISQSTPTQEFCGGTNWCMVSSIFDHASAIKTDGTLWSWGYGGLGQLAACYNFTLSKPTQEYCGATNWCMVSAGCNHTSAIKTDGTLWGWGDNFRGQLGINNVDRQSSPQQEICGGTTWCTVSSGGCYTSAIKADGTLWSWGYGNFGRLGTTSTIDISTPQQEVCGGTNWCMVSTGFQHNSAIKTDGTLWSWGYNNCGQLGTSLPCTFYTTPQQEACGGTNWCAVSSGDCDTSALKTDGTLWSWGRNYCGNLGTNNTTDYSTPQQEACAFTNWCTVSSGRYHTSGIRVT